MEEVRRNISVIIKDATSFNITIETAENRIAELLKSHIDRAKQDIIDQYSSLPNDCVEDCSDTKFCPNRLDHSNRCKECFSLDNI